MTYDEFLDNEKQRGVVIYRCRNKDCDFRGIGASVTYHELYHKDHYCYDEDSAIYAQMKHSNLCPKCHEWHKPEVDCLPTLPKVHSTIQDVEGEG